MRIKAIFEFDGSQYSGWQIQPNVITVQGEIERVLSKLCTRRVQVIGAGRTDAGVHARRMPIHFDILESELVRIQNGLDSMLPFDIACLSIREVNPNFHARFNAISRRYCYYIGKKKHPLRRRFEYQSRVNALNLSAMQEAVRFSLGHANWHGFAREGGGNTTWDMDVLVTSVKATKHGWELMIEANRFLRGVVRIWAGTILRVGLDRIPPKTIKAILDTADKKSVGTSLPACGLTLMEVKYPDEI